MREQINNLPWILQNVAKKLEDIADRISEEQSRGLQFETSSKLIKEALLAAFSSSAEGDNDSVAKLLDLIRKEGEVKKQSH